MGLKYIAPLGNYVFQHLYFVIGLRLAFFYRYGILRTRIQAGAQSIAKQITYESRLSINDLKRTLRAVGNTNAASVAFFLVNIDDLPSHIKSRYP